MLRIVYLTAVLLTESVLAQLKILGYSIRQVGDSSHLVGFEWPKGHHYSSLSEHPLYMSGGGRFCIEYKPSEDVQESVKFFCPSYQPGGELNIDGRLCGKTMFEVRTLNDETQIRRYVIVESENFHKKGFEGMPPVRHIVSYPSSIEQMPQAVIRAAFPYFPLLAARAA